MCEYASILYWTGANPTSHTHNHVHNFYSQFYEVIATIFRLVDVFKSSVWQNMQKYRAYTGIGV